MNASNRHVWSRVLVILIYGLTLGLLWVPGGECVPGAQAGPPAHPCFAPHAAGTDPSPVVHATLHAIRCDGLPDEALLDQPPQTYSAYVLDVSPVEPRVRPRDNHELPRIVCSEAAVREET